MSRILVLLCSPRENGVSDAMAGIFAKGAAACGASIIMEALRNRPIAPCTGCGHCMAPPHSCTLASGADGAERVFSLFEQAALVVVASPIYFYALPAHFKAFIDRGQRFWAARQAKESKARIAQKPVIPLLCAGRPRGELLFAGALRTLSWFAKNLDGRITGPQCARGLENPQDLRNKPELAKALFALGKNWKGILRQFASAGGADLQ